MGEEDEGDGIDRDWVTVAMPVRLHLWLMHESMASVPMRRHHRDVLEWIAAYAEAQLPED